MYKTVVKRVLDLTICILGFPLFAIIFIIVAPFIYFEDKGPVFYNGERIGRNGKLFKMYKFRSMRVNAPDIRLPDGSTYNGKDDSRVTKIGRLLRETSLDEVPQLINILKGEMSLIGPRPDPPDWIDKYPDGYRVFLTVRPGITGYSQAYYRNSDSSQDKMKHDKYYAENVSFLMDFRIIIKTIGTVLSHSNVYRDDKSNK